MKAQRVGLHVSAAGGVEHAPANASEFGAEVFQFFSRSPRGGGAKEITDEQAKIFRNQCDEFGMESYIHTPYYTNFASKNKRIYNGAINVVREELERGSKLGVKYVVTHMGSARDWVEDKKTTETPKEALNHVVAGLKQIYKDNPKLTSKLLLEISAGAGSVVGDTFEELAYLLNGVGRDDIHVCLDTCHMFASGYDIRDGKAIKETMRTFDKVLGVRQLKLVHLNDSKAKLGGRTDRHEHIGKGYIGSKGFKELLAHKDFKHVNFILETKHDNLIDKDIAFLKKYRKTS